MDDDDRSQMEWKAVSLQRNTGALIKLLGGGDDDELRFWEILKGITTRPTSSSSPTSSTSWTVRSVSCRNPSRHWKWSHRSSPAERPARRLNVHPAGGTTRCRRHGAVGRYHDHRRRRGADGPLGTAISASSLAKRGSLRILSGSTQPDAKLSPLASSRQRMRTAAGRSSFRHEQPGFRPLGSNSPSARSASVRCRCRDAPAAGSAPGSGWQEPRPCAGVAVRGRVGRSLTGHAGDSASPHPCDRNDPPRRPRTLSLARSPGDPADSGRFSHPPSIHPARPVPRLPRRGTLPRLRPLVAYLRCADVVPERILARLAAGWLDPRTGVIPAILVEPTSAAAPGLPIVVTAAPPHVVGANGAVQQLPLGWGKGLTLSGAILSAAGEAIERYAASLPDPARIVWARPDELEGDVLDPRCVHSTRRSNTRRRGSRSPASTRPCATHGRAAGGSAAMRRSGRRRSSRISL